MNKFGRMNSSLSEKEWGSKTEYFREREQYFHKHRVMQRFGAFRDSRGIWHGKDIGCAAGEARDETRES